MPANANLIQERSSSVPYYTDMRHVMQAIGISAKKFDWYLSDIETNVGDLFPADDRREVSDPARASRSNAIRGRFDH